jgi:hypothetical protein
MNSGQFQIPNLLSELIERQAWTLPESPPSLIVDLGAEAAHRLSPEDNHLILMPPPFHTIADEIEDGNTFWEADLSNVGEIDYSKALIIADFGLGSDSPIILYYEQPDHAKVMYLKWVITNHQAEHCWITTHSNFRDFAIDVGLVNNPQQAPAEDPLRGSSEA